MRSTSGPSCAPYEWLPSERMIDAGWCDSYGKKVPSKIEWPGPLT